MGGPTNPSEKPFFLGRVRGAFWGSVPIPLEGRSPQPERRRRAGPGRLPAFRSPPVHLVPGPRLPHGTGALLEVDGRAAARRPARPRGHRHGTRGDVLLKPFCPPYYKDTEEAVLAFVAYQLRRERGRSAMVASRPAGKMPRRCRRASRATPTGRSPRPSPILRLRPPAYGRFPGSTGPFRTVLAYQAHHVDTDFYDRFYRPEALTLAHRQHPDH